MKKLLFWGGVFFYLFLSLPLLGQEIVLKTVYKTDKVKFKDFAVKIRAPKQSTFYINYGDGTGVKQKYGSGQLESIFYDFADMDKNPEHTVTFYGTEFIDFIVISNREVTELKVKDCNELVNFSCANSKLKELDLSKCSKLKSLICNNNEIASLKVPKGLTTLRFSHNRLFLEDFPQQEKNTNYYYSPMRPAFLSDKKINGLSIDLSQMLYFQGVKEKTKSTFKWYYFDGKGTNADPQLLIPSSMYKENNGLFTFFENPKKPIYCVVENKALPYLNNINDQYGIMPIELKEKNKALSPVHFSFTTDKFTTDGLPFTISLSSKKSATPCIISWGDGSREEITLNEKEKTIKHNFINAKVDKKHIVEIQCASLKEVNIPEISGLLSINPVEKSPLTHLKISGNNIGSIDLSSLKSCEEISVNSCNLSQIKLPNDAPLKKLSLKINKIESIDISHFKDLEFLDISFNKLREIDLKNLSKLKSINLKNNLIQTFQLGVNLSQLIFLDCSFNAIPMYALPEKGNLKTYIYAPQKSYAIPKEDIKGMVVDLSKFHTLKGVANKNKETSFIWLHANDESLFVIKGVHYDENKGKFTFKLKEKTETFCVMQSEAFPALAGTKKGYRTYKITIDPENGITQNKKIKNDQELVLKSNSGKIRILSSSNTLAQIYDLNGRCIIKKQLIKNRENEIPLNPGIYLFKTSNAASFKFIVK